MADGIVMSVNGVVSRRAFKDPTKTTAIMKAAAASLGINTVDQDQDDWQQDLLDHWINDAVKRGMDVLERSDVEAYRSTRREQIKKEYDS